MSGSHGNIISLRLVEDKLLDFNRGGLWRLSLPAQIVIQQFFISLATDQVGLIGLREPKMRQSAQQKAQDNLEGFLGYLSEQAEALDKDARSGDEKVIGAIFAIQKVGGWAEMIGCGCLPRN